jgi:hypothetical protein
MLHIQPSEFWQWAYSDFLSNSLRGVLAEFIVAKALNCADSSRTEWDAYDLKTPDGLRIEVKSSAYLQTWEQKKPSLIQFDIAKKRSWFSETNQVSDTPARPADIYVFSVFSETEKAIANPLNLDQWFFLIASADFLDTKFGDQKSISLAVLEQHGLKRLAYKDIASQVARLAPNPSFNPDVASVS